MTTYRLRVMIVPNGTTYLRLSKLDSHALKLENGQIVEVENLNTIEE
jgi:hypothetical protein